MEIANAADAKTWLMTWDGSPRRGIAREVVRGLRQSAAISRTYGRNEAARDYDAAAAVIAPHAQ